MQVSLTRIVRRVGPQMVLAMALVSGCSEAHLLTPRSASGCVNISAAIPVYYIWQTAEDGGSCVRLDAQVTETGGSNVPGVTVEGSNWLVEIRRGTGPCETYSSPRFILANPSSTMLESAAGTLEFGSDILVSARLDLTFGTARDGSLGPSEMWFVAEDVPLTDSCVLE